MSIGRYYGQFEIPVDQFIYERYICDPDVKGVFVECGAFDGEVECSCRFFEESLGWTGYNLEASPPIFKMLEKNRPNSRNIEVGLSDHDGSATFQHAVAPGIGEHFGNGSIAHVASHLEHLQAMGCTFDTYNIRTITWDTFIKQEGITHVDLLVLDVEGHEMAVIKGMVQSTVLPDLLCVEFGHLGIDTLRDALAPMGYVYDITSFGNAFFIKQDRIALFALRRAGWLERQLANAKTVEAQIRTVGTQIRAVEAHFGQISAALEKSQSLLAQLDARIASSQASQADIKDQLSALTSISQQLDVIASSALIRLGRKRS